MPVFTDIVDSTAHHERLGDALTSETRALIDELQTTLITSNGGEIIKHLGDGLMASFPSATGALLAATGIQTELHRIRDRLAAPIKLRIGIAAGDVIESNDDFFGLPVVKAARLCDAVREGGILVSDLVRQLATEDNEFDFHDPQPLPLKGITEPVLAWKLRWVEDEAVLDVPHELRPDPTFGFVGRDQEWQQLLSAWQAASTGEGQVAVIAGEAGVGKTRLAARLVANVQAEGGTVLFGRNSQDLDVPFQPFAEALKAYVQSQPAWLIEHRLGPSRGELVRLLPSLDELVGASSATDRPHAESETFQLFEAVTQWLATASMANPVLFVIDDLHWASTPTIQLLRHIAGSPRMANLLIVATHRPAHTEGGSPVPNLPLPPHRFHEIALAPFDEAGVLAFIEAAAGHPLDETGSDLAAHLWALSGGNPFFCRELVVHLVDKGILTRHDGRWTTTLPLESAGIPSSIRRVVDGRLALVDDTARSALLWSAMLGSSFDLSMLAPCVGLSDERVIDALDQCVQARLLQEHNADTFYFPHDLVRSTLLASIAGSRGKLMHRRIAEVLGQRHLDGRSVQVAELARHFEIGATDDQLLEACNHWIQAGDQAAAQFAHGSAFAAYDRALKLLKRAPAADRTAELEADLATLLASSALHAGYPNARELLTEAQRAAALSDDPRRMAKVLLAGTGGPSAWQAGTVDPDRVALFEQTLDQLPRTDDPLRARLLVQLGSELQYAGDDILVAQLGEEATAMARRLGDPKTLIAVLIGRLGSQRSPAKLDLQLADALELGRLSRETGDRRAEFLAAYRVADIHLALLDRTSFIGAVETATRLADELREPSLQIRARRIATEIAWLDGDLDLVERGLDQLWAIVTEVNQEHQHLAATMGARAKLAGARGRPQVAVEAYERLAALPNSIDGFRAGLAVSYLANGQTDQAVAIYNDLMEQGLENLVIDGLSQVHTWCFLASLAASLEDRDRAPQLEAALAPFANRWVAAASNGYGPVEHFVARLQATQGNIDQALKTFATADDRCVAMQAVLLRAWNQISWAECLACAGDSDGARDLATAAAATARDKGAPGIEAAAAQVLDTLALDDSQRLASERQPQ